jgi:Arc/MetJ-type ribon-helix-helix transcriptional regulator
MGKDLWEAIKGRLSQEGIDLDELCRGVEGIGEAVKCVVVAPDLRSSVEEMSKSPRDQVVMVRLDEESAGDLDAWVETGAVKSRSEAAALFIREGLKVRAGELEQLKESLRAVRQAKERLRERAAEIFGKGGPRS